MLANFTGGIQTQNLCHSRACLSTRPPGLPRLAKGIRILKSFAVGTTTNEAWFTLHVNVTQTVTSVIAMNNLHQLTCVQLFTKHSLRKQPCDVNNLYEPGFNVKFALGMKNNVLFYPYPNCFFWAKGNYLSTLFILVGHTSRILHMCMSPDGSTVATAAGDETLRLWKCFQSETHGKSAKKGPRDPKAMSGTLKLRQSIR